MRVLHVAAEAYPLAKTGGLADVVAALVPALCDLGMDARLLLPAYPRAVAQLAQPRHVAEFPGLLGYGDVRLIAGRLPDTGVPVWLVDCPRLYERAGGLYQDESGRDWSDNAARFALLAHVAAAIGAGSAGLDWQPDIVHAHDWHAGLVPLLLSQHAGAVPVPASVLTIHNLAYQGVFPSDAFAGPGMPSDIETWAALEFYGQISFLKAGLVTATALTTVSPTYAKEILTPEYGCGLDGLLRHRAACLSGVMNGADYGIWDPAGDPHLGHGFSIRDMAAKRACKAAIQAEMGLDPMPDTPLVAFSSRLAHQKMPDTVLEALPVLLAEGVQFALVAEGDPVYETQFHELASRYPGRAAVRTDYNEPLAHRLLAGADILLHPSRFEPCGLAPIYAMRYGAVPVVRRSGGACDSVVDATPDALRREEATGFSFVHATADNLIDCTRRALDFYRQPIIWRQIQRSAMQQDFGWTRPARAYTDLYRAVRGRPVWTPSRPWEAVDFVPMTRPSALPPRVPPVAPATAPDRRTGGGATISDRAAAAPA